MYLPYGFPSTFDHRGEYPGSTQVMRTLWKVGKEGARNTVNDLRQRWDDYRTIR